MDKLIQISAVIGGLFILGLLLRMVVRSLIAYTISLVDAEFQKTVKAAITTMDTRLRKVEALVVRDFTSGGPISEGVLTEELSFTEEDLIPEPEEGDDDDNAKDENRDSQRS